jgi:cytochrome b561
MTTTAPTEQELKAAHHPTPIKYLHWLTVVALIFGYALAWSIDQASSAAEARFLLMLHRSIGVTIMVLTIARFLIRQRSEMPALPSDIPLLQRIAARTNEGLLYLLLILQPALGLIASWVHGDQIIIFGLGIPKVLPIDRTLGRLLFSLHGWVAVLLLLLIGVHVMAALFHHFIRRDNVLAGMLPTRVAQHHPSRLRHEPQR